MHREKKVPLNPRKLALYTLLFGIVTFALISFFYLSLDLPIAEAAHSLKGTFIVTAGKLISDLASKHVIQTITFITLVAGAIDAIFYGLSLRAKSILLVSMSTMTAMLTGDELKWLFGRCRPPMFFEDSAYGFAWFSGKYIQNSFPSGHTLRAFSLATAVSMLLPRKKAIPLLIATAVGISRVIVSKHYPSDVIFGCFIGVTCAIWSYFFLFDWNKSRQQKPK